jgi:hypothetical protein
MEVVLNWNVYKVFKNGKRAKAPLATFEYDDESSVSEHFEAEVKKNFSEKIRDWNFTLLPENISQERPEEKADKQEEDVFKKQGLILSRFVKKNRVKSKYKVVGGLIFAKATDWKWQWCALEGGTNNFIAGLSPRFNNPTEAQQWMNKQVQNLT